MKRTDVRVAMGEAREVILTGDFTGWATDRIRMERDDFGLWTVALRLAPGEYQYRLIVDGEWRDDPAAPKSVPNPFGSHNAVLTVSR